MRVAAFTKYDRQAASTRQRLLQYLPRLAEAGIHVDVFPLLSDDYVQALETGGGFSKGEVVISYAKRLAMLLRGVKADCIFVYAELFPYLPAVFERLVFRSGKPVIYDFDDAFYITYDQMGGAKAALLRNKLQPLISGAAVCLCGNPYLRDYAARLDANALVVPTVVDTDAYLPRARGDDAVPTIGWIGSPSTWRYVSPHLPLLRELCARGARFLAVGAGEQAWSDRFHNSEFRDWSEAREIADVQEMDVGIMPLPDEPWTRGKSGYKLVQYMACGAPVVASPVGVNSTIVEHGKHGFLAGSLDDWGSALRRLLSDPALRQSMGALGRARIVESYSLNAQAPRIIELFRRTIGAHGRFRHAAIASR